MIMQRKQYGLIAQVLRTTKPLIDGQPDEIGEAELEQWRATICSFARALKRDNSAFKPDKFIKACGMD